MRVFKTKAFNRFARKEDLRDKMLAKAVADIERGLIDALLGGGLVKQRLARPGAGKRGGYRTIIAYRMGETAVFLFGFAKNEQANISHEDERDLKDYGALLLALGEKERKLMIDNGELWEVPYDKENEKTSQ